MSDDRPDFEGHAQRRCGEHRTVGSHRAWCYTDSEWCSPSSPCSGCDTLASIEYVREFHETFGVTVRDVPTTDITPDERLLRARLVLKEALEFVEAMGCVLQDGPGLFNEVIPSVMVVLDHGAKIDLVEAADALADLDYVVAGSALTLGIPHGAVVREVHHSNMSKLGADGKPIYREVDGKILKGPGYSPPDVAGVLRAASAP